MVVAQNIHLIFSSAIRRAFFTSPAAASFIFGETTIKKSFPTLRHFFISSEILLFQKWRPTDPLTAADGIIMPNLLWPQVFPRAFTKKYGEEKIFFAVLVFGLMGNLNFLEYTLVK
jgi:hypothetical protein